MSRGADTREEVSVLAALLFRNIGLTRNSGHIWCANSPKLSLLYLYTVDEA